MSHTPGPWTTIPELPCDFYQQLPDGLAYLGECADSESCDGKANARLIAAAPELLEALKLATKELNAIRARDGAPQHISWDRGKPLQTSGCTEEWWNELTEKCLSVIAKAEGGDCT